MSTTTTSASPYLPVRDDWLARQTESILEPALPIVDPHHHLWERPGWRYMLEDLLADTNSGHNIVGTVFVQCRSMHRADGPEEFRPVGETEFVNGVAAMSASGGYGATKICAGIVGHVDLRLGGRAREVLEAHIRAGGGRFRGIRHITAYDADPTLMNPAYSPPVGLMGDKMFREGFGCLAPLNLTFDAWLYHPQISDVTALAQAFPGTGICLNHIGGPLAIGSYGGRREEIFATWSKSIRELAACPNVVVKLGGMAMRINGWDFHEKTDPPSSETLAAAWKPYVETCIEAFGANRCMFESNFPVDKGSYGYAPFWNACKILAKNASAAEKTDLFSATAPASTASIFNTGASWAMKTLKIGDVTITSIIERDGPWRKPADMFPAYDDAVGKRHLAALEPEIFDPATGLMVITYQTFVVRTPHHTILVDTCTGEDKGYKAPMDFPKRRWLDEFKAAGLTFDSIDYVFCTHLHIDHCGWNTVLREGKWVPTFPRAKYIFHKKEYAAWEEATKRGAEPPGDVWRFNCEPIVAAGQALLVDDDYALDDTVWLSPTPGHSPCHCCVNIKSGGQRAVVTGDMMHHALQCREPDWSTIFDWDAKEAAISRRRFLGEIAGTGTFVLPIHFPNPDDGPGRGRRRALHLEIREGVMRAYHFDHVHLRSPDPEATASFFETMFGAEAMRDIYPPGTLYPGEPRISLTLGGQKILIAPTHPHDAMTEAPAFPYYGLEHIGLTVDNVDEACEELRRKGADIAIGPLTRSAGLRLAFVRGPEGIMVELVQR